MQFRPRAGEAFILVTAEPALVGQRYDSISIATYTTATYVGAGAVTWTSGVDSAHSRVFSYEGAVQERPEFLPLRTQWAMALLNLGEAQRAREVLEEGSAGNSRSSRALYLLSESQRQTRDYAAAEVTARRLIALDTRGLLGPQQLAIFLSQSVNGNFQRSFGRAELLGEQRQSRLLALPGQKRLEGFKLSQLAGRHVLLPQPGERPLQEGQGPAALEDALGRPSVGRLMPITAFALFKIERQHRPPAAALLRRGLIALLLGKP